MTTIQASQFSDGAGDARGVDAAQIISFPSFGGADGLLTVFERGKGVPMQIERVFTVSAKPGAARGAHAHRDCTQLLVCLAGSIAVTLRDGAASRDVRLEAPAAGQPASALLIPPMIWGEQSYEGASPLLMVLCDMGYDESEYIRDWDAFVSAKAAARKGSAQ